MYILKHHKQFLCLFNYSKDFSVNYMCINALLFDYMNWGSSFTKIRPQANIDNFAFKNSNIIIEGLFWKRKDYFSWKKFETQKNNFINKFYFCLNLFSYCFEPNFFKWCDSNKSWFIFSGKRLSTTWPFPIFEIELIIIKCSNLFIKMLLWKIVFS